MLKQRSKRNLTHKHWLKIAVRYFAVTAVECSVFVAVSAAPKDVSIETIERIKLSVVPIVCAYSEDNNVHIAAGIGTGFFVDSFGRFVTAGHVLNDWEKIAPLRHACAPATYIPDHGWRKFERTISFESFAFVNCDREADLDLAVCEPTDNPFTSTKITKGRIAPVTFDTYEWPDGSPVAFTGFPLEYVMPITSKGFVGGHMATPHTDSNFDYAIDKAAWPGCSGSPLYTESGRVIGILLAAGANAGTGLSYARSAAVIVDFLARHPHINRQTQAAPAQQRQADPNTK